MDDLIFTARRASAAATAAAARTAEPSDIETRFRTLVQSPLRAAISRNDRPRREDADRLRVDPDGGEIGHLGADSGTDRIGQGSRRPDDPRAEPPERRQAPGGEHRGAARFAVRI